MNDMTQSREAEMVELDGVAVALVSGGGGAPFTFGPGGTTSPFTFGPGQRRVPWPCPICPPRNLW